MTIDTIFFILDLRVKIPKNLFSHWTVGIFISSYLNPFGHQSTQNAILSQNTPSQPKVDRMSKLVKTTLK